MKKNRFFFFLAASIIIFSTGGCSQNVSPFHGSPNQSPQRLFSEAWPQNLLLITIDTLRADHLGCYGNQSIQTPFIDALANQGILFHQAFTPVPLTLPSHASILTGLYPPAHGIRDNGYFILGDRHQTLAEIFKAKGYVTGAVVASYVLDSRFGLAQGFDFYEDDIVPDPNGKDPFRYERRADKVTALAEKWLSKKRSEKFFLWLHFFDPHEPYNPPEPYKNDYAQTPYDGEIAFTDACLGKLIRKMEEFNIWHNTMIVLTSDHGEGLGEHEEKTHGVFIYDTTLHIPLIISTPGCLAAGRTYNFLIRSIDIFPTILGFMGLTESEKKYGQGINLVPLLMLNNKTSSPNLLLYCESLYTQLNFGWSSLTGVRSNEWKYINAPTPELYHISLDPNETRNLYTDKPRFAQEWESRLTHMEKTVSPISGTNMAISQTVPDAEVRRRLESLGYICAPRKAAAASSIDPKDRIFVLNEIDYGQNLYAQGQLDAAAVQFEKILTLDSGNIFLHYLLGNIYKQLKDYTKAIDHYRAVLQEQKDYLEVHNNIGSLYDRLGKYDLALDHFKRSASLRPESPRAYHNMGIIFIKTNRLAEAEKAFLQALALSESNSQEKAVNYKCLADTYLRLKDEVKALEFYRKALGLRPKMEDVYLELARYYTAKRDYALAIPQWEKVISFSPQDAQAFFKLGQCYVMAGEREKARESLQQCLQIQPDHRQARRLLEHLTP